MAQAGPGNSGVGAFTNQMRDLHLKLHQSGIKANDHLKPPQHTYSQANFERGQSPSEHINRNTPPSRSVYTWTRGQGVQPQALKRTVSPVTVDTNWNFDFKRNASIPMTPSPSPRQKEVTSFHRGTNAPISPTPRQTAVAPFQRCTNTSMTPSPRQAEIPPFQRCTLPTHGVLQNVTLAKTNKTSLENSPDSGLSLGSDRVAPGSPFGHSAKQEGPLRFPHQMLNMAFKPVGPMGNNNGPVSVNLAQPVQNPRFPAIRTDQYMQQVPIGHNFQSSCPKQIIPNINTPPISPYLLAPVSAFLKTSPDQAERPAKRDPAFLPTSNTYGTSTKIALTPIVKDNSKPTSPTTSRSVKFSQSTSLQSPPAPGNTCTNIKPEEKITSDEKDVEMCSCNRPPNTILCKTCGETCTGRIRQKCKAHPNQIFLMDMSCCPQCQSENLKEIVGCIKA